MRSWGAKALLRPLQILFAAPSLLFLAALTAMLLRHPDVQFYEIDRVAFGLLVLGAVGRAMLARTPLFRVERATWPMLGLTALVIASAAGQPFDHEAWSLLASKFIVPFALFHLAGMVFREDAHFRQFEIFLLIVLAYLSFTAIAFLVGARSLIFPRFILDESLGFQADRARGPLLQAVANGVSLNMLGAVGLPRLQARKLSGKQGADPARVGAGRDSGNHDSGSLAGVCGIGARISFHAEEWSMSARLHRVADREHGRICPSRELGPSIPISTGTFEERGPLDYRAAVYAGGWDMFLQRPWLGWGFHQMPAELPRHVSGYHEKVLYPHNTYLEIVAEHGLLGLALYLWLMWEMWRLGRGAIPVRGRTGFLDGQFHKTWPILLASLLGERRTRGDELPVCERTSFHNRRNVGGAKTLGG